MSENITLEITSNINLHQHLAIVFFWLEMKNHNCQSTSADWFCFSLRCVLSRALTLKFTVYSYTQGAWWGTPLLISFLLGRSKKCKKETKETFQRLSGNCQDTSIFPFLSQSLFLFVAFLCLLRKHRAFSVLPLINGKHFRGRKCL